MFSRLHLGIGLQRRSVLHHLEREIEIANPQHPHCATVLLLDTSSSMQGNKIAQLNAGLVAFREQILRDDLARKRVEVAVVTFSTDVCVRSPFSSVDEFAPPSLEANGSTAMGGGILKAIALVEERKAVYKTAGTDYYRPWIFLITDGEPTDMKPDDTLWEQVRNAVHEGEARKRFLFFAVGVDTADMERLTLITPPNRPPIRLRDGCFGEMFEWVSRSQQTISASQVGEQVSLPDATGPQGWGTIPTT
jgi:uncharacterized protein YegL